MGCSALSSFNSRYSMSLTAATAYYHRLYGINIHKGRATLSALSWKLQVSVHSHCRAYDESLCSSGDFLALVVRDSVLSLLSCLLLWSLLTWMSKSWWLRPHLHLLQLCQFSSQALSTLPSHQLTSSGPSYFNVHSRPWRSHLWSFEDPTSLCGQFLIHARSTARAFTLVMIDIINNHLKTFLQSRLIAIL